MKLLTINIGLLLGFCSAAAIASETFTSDSYQTIAFDDIAKTDYKFKGDSLEVTVDQSSSVKMKAFDEVQAIKKVSFDYKVTGELKLTKFSQHQDKDGDDAYFRVGMLRSGDAPSIPFFAPAWIKKSSKLLKLPSDKLIYLVLTPLTNDHKKWESPYSSSIENIALTSSAAGKDGWRSASFVFREPLPTVGYWLMADGDNTKSQFKLQIKNLKFEK